MFNKLREKTGKRFVQKYEYGKPIFQSSNYTPGLTQGEKRQLGPKVVQWDGSNWIDQGFASSTESYPMLQGINTESISAPDLTTMSIQPQTTELFTFGQENGVLGQTIVSANNTGIAAANSATGQVIQYNNNTPAEVARVENNATLGQKTGNVIGQLMAMQGPTQNAGLWDTGLNAFSALGNYAASNGGSLSGALSNGSVTGAIGQFANAAIDKLDNAVMGDKTFDAQSEAVDDAVRMASQELSKKWPPWGLLAAGVVEGLNFADKAVGKTVQGYEVGNAGSGFGGIETHQDSLSYRGTQTGKMRRNLARRQEQVNMALAASSISAEETFQLQARANSVQNTMDANRIALAGGIDTGLLGG